MKPVLIVGRPNVGKTCFLINFAHYLGLEKLNLFIQQPAGFVVNKSYQLRAAGEKLTSLQPHRTKKLQHIELELASGCRREKIRLIDSCGLVSRIHGNDQIRVGMTQTLQQLFASPLVLHMIDISEFDYRQGLNPVDDKLFSFSQQQSGYRILANKIDLDRRQQKLAQLQKLIAKELVIPISALYRQGLAEVETFLLHNL